MADITAENCESLFLFSTITSYFGRGKPKGPAGYLLVKNHEIPIWLSLFRGTRLLLDAHWESLHSSVLLPLFHRGQQAHMLWLAGCYEENALDELAEKVQDRMSDDPARLCHLSVPSSH